MRTSARMTGAVAATAVAALLMTGCGSGDSGNSGDDKPSPDPSAVESGSPEKPGGAEAGAEDAEDAEDAAKDAAADALKATPGKLPGVWQTKAEGKDFVLTISGDAATLLRDQKLCSGRLMDGDPQTLVLKCPGGIGEERTNGSVEELKGTSLKVSWNGGDTDTFTKLTDAPKTLPKDPKELENLLPSQ